jgi:prolipoprotein diacylglyceryltransferase
VTVAAILLEFDPLVRIAGRAVRAETILLGLVILGVLVLAAILARSMSAGQDPGLFMPGPRQRADDLLFIVLGIVPGAVIGGRLAYALVHADFYAATPAAILDPGQGSLQLTGAVVGGLLAGAAIARLLDGSVGRWLHVATIPTLLGLALGKVAMAVGGDGQGQPTDLPWATAYVGPGPWGSLAPSIAAHPAQLYEAATSLAVLLAAVLLLAAGAFRRADGSLFLVALAGWAVGRAVVAVTWRDAEVLGPFRADQGLAILIAAVAIGLTLAWRREVRRRSVEPDWPDPETRPAF